MKNITEIKEKLDDFYQGKTSAEEETLLRNFFDGPDVPHELEDEKAAFRMMFQSDEPDIPKGLESRLSSLIEDLEKDESKPAPRKAKRRWLEIGGIAASICLLVSVGLFVLNQGNEIAPANKEQHNPSAACLSPQDEKKIIEARKALEMVSRNFNKGIEGMESAAENLPTSNL